MTKDCVTCSHSPHPSPHQRWIFYCKTLHYAMSTFICLEKLADSKYCERSLDLSVYLAVIAGRQLSAKSRGTVRTR